MANFSSFFPSAGGGGSTAATTKEINGVTYENVYTTPDAAFYHASFINSGDIFLDENTNLQSYQISTMNDSNLYTLDMSAQTLGSYHTVANITSATNGGFFYWAVSAAPVTSLISGYKIKITIDGTAYEYIGDGNDTTSRSYNRFILGAFLPLAKNGTNYRNALISGGMTTKINNTNKTLDRTYIAMAEGVYLPDSYVIKEYGMKKIYFETSCKVEMQMSTYNANSSQGLAGALIETL
jgi:hypothetical protein